MLFSELKFEDIPEDKVFSYTCADGSVVEIKIKQYLPIEEKGKLIDFVMGNCFDPNTNAFSPVMYKIFSTVALIKFYSDIDVEEENVLKVFNKIFTDICAFPGNYSNSFFGQFKSYIPIDERLLVDELLLDTIEAYERFSNSAAGIIYSMNQSSNELNKNLNEILASIKNREGLEFIEEIMNNEVGQA